MRALSSVLGMGACLIAAVASTAAPLAYVPAGASGDVSVIDTDRASVVATFRVGRGPVGVAIHPSGSYVYVGNLDDKTLSVIDAQAETCCYVVPVQGTPIGLAVHPDGTRIYVAAMEGWLNVVDTTLPRVIGRVDLVQDPALEGASPYALTISPDGRRVFVSSVFSNRVIVVDAATHATLGSVNVTMPAGLAFDPTGRWLYVGSRGSRRVTVVDSSTLTVSGIVTVGGIPSWLVVHPTAERLYVVNEADSTMSVVDTTTRTVVGTIRVGFEPRGIDVAPHGARVYVTNASSDSVSVVDTRVNAVVATVPVGTRPLALGRFIGPDLAPIATAKVTVVEYYHRAFDHYFMTWATDEIATLDAGTQIRGWERTGYAFSAYTSPERSTVPVCRFYIPPAQGDSHYFGRNLDECSATRKAHPNFTLESADFLRMFMPLAGTCEDDQVRVYRVFNGRPDANHRYTTDRGVRDRMIAEGWIAEGDGPDRVTLCAPSP